MPWGGKREGAGRKPGSVNKISRLSRIACEEAAKTGELPHQLLLRVARGDVFCGRPPSFDERFEAMKMTLPYYAAKLAPINGMLPDHFVTRLIEIISDESRAHETRRIANRGTDADSGGH